MDSLIVAAAVAPTAAAMITALGIERRDFLFKNTASCLSTLIYPEWAEVVHLHNLFSLLMSEFAFPTLIFAERLSQYLQ